MRPSRICLSIGISLFLSLAVLGQAPQRRAATKPQPRQALQVAASTPIEVRLLSEINSGKAKDGDSFSATVMTPLVVSGSTLLAKDARVSGRVIKAVSSGRLKQPALLTLELTSAGNYTVRTEPVTLDAKSHAKRNTALIGGGAAVGAIIGAIAGGGKGAAIGAASGAAAGTAGAYLTGKQELVLPVETALRFVTAATSATGQGQPRILSDTPTERPRPTETTVTEKEPRILVNRPPGRPREPEITMYTIPEQERNAINNYLRTNTQNLPPGLARREKLPPGLERQIQTRGTLPPGLQKRIQPFPPDLSRQLAPLPAGLSRVFVGNHAMVLDQAQRVLDHFTVQY